MRGSCCVACALSCPLQDGSTSTCCAWMIHCSRDATIYCCCQLIACRSARLSACAVVPRSGSLCSAAGCRGAPACASQPASQPEAAAVPSCTASALMQPLSLNASDGGCCCAGAFLPDCNRQRAAQPVLLLLPSLGTRDAGPCRRKHGELPGRVRVAALQKRADYCVAVPHAGPLCWAT